MIDESNRTAETIRDQLLSFGVEPAKAHAASVRYSTIEAAANWVFGDGENWKPEEDEVKPAPTASLNPFHTSGVTARPPSPAMPAQQMPQEQAPQFQSNNPFNQYAFPAPPTAPPGIAHEDDDLRRAIELSTQQEEEDRGRRVERERSVRASAPPPSPGRIDDDGQVVGSLFGPSNKEDLKGALAMVPTDNNTPSNKEEEDFQRAIQESMMTASFHSAGGESNDTLPPPTERDPLAPLAYVARKDISWAANIMQALAAVPQLREGFWRLERLDTDPPTFMDVQNVFGRQNSSEYSYESIDKEVDAINAATGLQPGSVILPPVMPLIEYWISHLRDILRAVVVSRVASAQDNLVNIMNDSPIIHDLMRSPDQLMTTRLNSQPDTPQTHVTIDRSYSTPTDIHGNLGSIIWNSGAPDESIVSIADVVFVVLRRTPGVNVQKWEFDEQVILDRYMSDNVAWATNVRAQENLLKVDLRRLQEQIEALSTFRGNSLPDALQTVLKQLGTDESENQGRTALKQKLERISETMKTKLAALQEQAKEKETTIQSGLFATDDPALNRHGYRLRSILWHDGFTTPGKHTFAYVHHGDDWWKIEETEVTKVDWETIQGDTTGQYTDGGPYLLLYSREGPRPEGYSRDDHLLSPPSGSASSSVSEEPMEEVDSQPTLANFDDRSARQPILSAQSDSDLLMDADDEEEIKDWKASPQQGRSDLIMQEDQRQPASNPSQTPTVTEKRRVPPLIESKSVPEAPVEAGADEPSTEKKATL